MKILVTGGAGFIGSHIVEKLLQEQCRVAVMDNLSTGCRENVPGGVKFFEMDICSEQIRDVFNNEGFDAVIHLAAQTMVPVSLDKPDYDCLVNILGTVNILEACRKTGVKRVVFASSAAVYGDTGDVPLAENSKTMPASFYGLSKLIGEKYLQMYHEQYGLEYVVLRYANVYGERQGDGGEGGVISIFSRKICRNEPLTIFGDGGQTRDFIHAGDVADANWLALIVPDANHIFNVSTQTETSLHELVHIMQSVSGYRVRKSFAREREGDIYRSALANNKAYEQLGWKPKISLYVGLNRVFNHCSGEVGKCREKIASL